MNTNQFLTDLFERRAISRNPGYLPERFLELYGAKMVDLSSYEPDPRTHHSDFYYNTKTNVLYKKVIKQQANESIIFWQKVSN